MPDFVHWMAQRRDPSLAVPPELFSATARIKAQPDPELPQLFTVNASELWETVEVTETFVLRTGTHIGRFGMRNDFLCYVVALGASPLFDKLPGPSVDMRFSSIIVQANARDRGALVVTKAGMVLIEPDVIGELTRASFSERDSPPVPFTRASNVSMLPATFFPSQRSEVLGLLNQFGSWISRCMIARVQLDNGVVAHVLVLDEEPPAVPDPRANEISLKLSKLKSPFGVIYTPGMRFGADFHWFERHGDDLVVNWPVGPVGTFGHTAIDRRPGSSTGDGFSLGSPNSSS